MKNNTMEIKFKEMIERHMEDCKDLVKEMVINHDIDTTLISNISDLMDDNEHYLKTIERIIKKKS